MNDAISERFFLCTPEACAHKAAGHTAAWQLIEQLNTHTYVLKCQSLQVYLNTVGYVLCESGATCTV